MTTKIVSAAKLAEELNRLASHLETAADDLDRTRPGDKPARGRLANEYAILAGDRLLLGAKGGAIQDRLLLAYLDVDLLGDGRSAEHVYQITRNKAFLAASLTWLPTVAPDHRPDKHNVARWYADDLRALADAVAGVESLEDAPAPLTETQQEAYNLIVGDGPKSGKEIVRALGISSESSFTSHYVPALKKYGIVNRRGLGYYHAGTYTPPD